MEVPWQRCGGQHTGGQRAAVHTAAFIQKVTLSQDDMRLFHAQRNIISQPLFEIVYFLVPFWMDSGGGWTLTQGKHWGISERKQ